MASEKNDNRRNEWNSENPKHSGAGSKSDGGSKYTFIQEKIMPKKKKRLKRFAAAFFGTVVLACIFGVVAQIVFVCSEPWILKLFGRDQDSGRQQVVLPSGEPASSNTGQSEDPSGQGENPSGTSPDSQDHTEASEGTGIVTGTPLPGDQSDIEILPTTSPEDETEEDETVIIEQRVEADITDYISIYSDVRKLISQVSSSILTVTAVTNGVDWFNYPYEERETTSGVVLADNGTDLLILASLDRIENADRIEIEINSSLSVEGTVLDYDRDVNLAIIAVPLASIPEVTLNLINKAELGESYTITVGTPILAVGSPNGHEGSAELGIITSKGSSVYIVDNRLDLFNTDITDNEYSDGIIVNMQGQVIGIITHTLKEGLNEEISTAIGISKIMPIIQRLVNNEDRIYFGIHGEDLPEEILEQAGIENGIYVNEVEAGSPALQAGIMSGDMIVRIGNTPITSMTTFYNTISTYNVRDSVQVLVRRQSQGSFRDVTVTVELAKKEG